MKLQDLKTLLDTAIEQGIDPDLTLAICCNSNPRSDYYLMDKNETKIEVHLDILQDGKLVAMLTY